MRAAAGRDWEVPTRCRRHRWAGGQGFPGRLPRLALRRCCGGAGAGGAPLSAGAGVSSDARRVRRTLPVLVDPGGGGGGGWASAAVWAGAAAATSRAEVRLDPVDPDPLEAPPVRRAFRRGAVIAGPFVSSDSELSSSSSSDSESPRLTGGCLATTRRRFCGITAGGLKAVAGDGWVAAGWRVAREMAALHPRKSPVACRSRAAGVMTALACMARRHGLVVPGPLLR